MPFLATEHLVAVLPVRLRCIDVRCRGVDCDGDHGWGRRALCSACPRFKGARRETYERAEQDGLAHLRAKGQGVRG